MTLWQYLKHLQGWLYTFPRHSEDEHLFAGPVNSGDYRCIICGAREVVTDETTADEFDITDSK